MQYDRHKFGDVSAAATGLCLATLPTMFDKYANTLEQAGSGPILTPDPELRGTSDSAAAEERRGFRVSDANQDECAWKLTWRQNTAGFHLHLQRIRNQSLRLLSKS
jgi:hypothetical protein